MPAEYRIFFFFAWETFCPLVVISSNKSYQQFAMKKIGENFSFVLLKLSRGKVRPIIREENQRGARNRPGLEPEGRILKRYLIWELYKVRKKIVWKFTLHFWTNWTILHTLKKVWKFAYAFLCIAT